MVGFYTHPPKQNIFVSFHPTSNLSSMGLFQKLFCKSQQPQYPVIMLDHEDGFDEHKFYSKNFLEMFNEFNSSLDDKIRINREEERRRKGDSNSESGLNYQDPPEKG